MQKRALHTAAESPYVATLQLSKGDENGNLVNYSYDECWQMAQDSINLGIQYSREGGTIGFKHGGVV